MSKPPTRKKNTRPNSHQKSSSHQEQNNNPRWLVPFMVIFFLVGLFWIIVFYVSQTRHPIVGIGAWNMVLGFAFIFTGLILATRWR
jgi:Cell division protein CrgA